MNTRDQSGRNKLLQIFRFLFEYDYISLYNDIKDLTKEDKIKSSTIKENYSQIQESLSGRPRGEMTGYWYAGMDTGDSQVGGRSYAKARWEVFVDKEGGRIYLGGKSNDGRGGNGGW